MDAGLEIRINMMAELRGDTAARKDWYKAMNEIGVFSVNDIEELEPMIHAVEYPLYVETIGKSLNDKKTK